VVDSKPDESKTVEKRLDALEKRVEMLMKNLYKRAPSDQTIFLETLTYKSSRDKYRDESDNRKIYVGNFSPNKNVEQMKEYFSKYGEITEAFFVSKFSDSQNGFVCFSEQAMAQAALDDCPHYMNQRFLNVAKPKGRRSLKVGSHQPEAQDEEAEEESDIDPDTKKLLEDFVKQYEKDLEERMLLADQ